MAAARVLTRFVTGGVAVIRFDDPSTRNALTQLAFCQLAEALDAAIANDSVHAIALTGAGRGYFCTGGEPGEMAAMLAALTESQCWHLHGIPCRARYPLRRPVSPFLLLL